MASLNGFNANNVGSSKDFPPIPSGKYPAVIIASEKRMTKNGTGEILELTLKILEGNFKGRRLWDHLNWKNTNPKAEAIAKSKLAAVCHAVGVLEPNDSSELHDLPLTITITGDDDSFGGGRSQVVGYAKI